MGPIQAIIDFLSAIVEFVVNFFVNIAKALADVVVGIVNGLWDVIKFLLSGILSALSTLVGWIGDLLKSLFVPSDKYFDSKINSMQNTLNTKVDTASLENALNAMKGVGAREYLPQTRASLFGLDINIDILSFAKENLGMIHMFVRAIFYAILIKYNINSIYKLIRGSDMESGGSE